MRWACRHFYLYLDSYLRLICLAIHPHYSVRRQGLHLTLGRDSSPAQFRFISDRPTVPRVYISRIELGYISWGLLVAATWTHKWCRHRLDVVSRQTIVQSTAPPQITDQRESPPAEERKTRPDYREIPSPHLFDVNSKRRRRTESNATCDR